MKNIKIFDKLKRIIENSKLIKKNSKTIIEQPNITSKLIITESNGFQLMIDDLSPYLKNFLREGFISHINFINKNGYLDPEIGKHLRDISPKDGYDTYTKSINSNDVESIFDEGIRCLGNISRGYNKPLNSTEDIMIEDTVKKENEFTLLINSIKNNFGLSEGGNLIDGTILLQIPKASRNEDILYFNENSKTFNIKPEYIIGFLPITHNYETNQNRVEEFIMREKTKNK